MCSGILGIQRCKCLSQIKDRAPIQFLIRRITMAVSHINSPRDFWLPYSGNFLSIERKTKVMGSINNVPNLHHGPVCFSATSIQRCEAYPDIVGFTEILGGSDDLLAV